MTIENPIQRMNFRNGVPIQQEISTGQRKFADSIDFLCSFYIYHISFHSLYQVLILHIVASESSSIDTQILFFQNFSFQALLFIFALFSVHLKNLLFSIFHSITLWVISISVLRLCTRIINFTNVNH